LAGLYLHIPFCRKVCYYCDFHFTVSFKQKQRVLDAIKKELILRNEEFQSISFDSLYFGGGTPSVLNQEEWVELFQCIHLHYKIQSTAEITIEANPDDLTNNYLQELKENTPINRLSIGVQSFDDRFLKLMNRRHTAGEAMESIKRAVKAGFRNINIDLIYGIPGMTADIWKYNLQVFSELNIPHLSAYHLTIEPRTVFAYYQKRGRLDIIPEEESSEQFEYLMNFLSDLGYDHYEISNFALPEYYSRHNLGYWTGEPYLGAGPSAHSYYNKQRRWNISNNTKYCDEIENGGENYFTVEEINDRIAYHDYLITAMRTKWGINLEDIRTRFGEQIFQHVNMSAIKFKAENLLIQQQDYLILSKRGKLIADYIIREMMLSDQES